MKSGLATITTVKNLGAIGMFQSLNIALSFLTVFKVPGTVTQVSDNKDLAGSFAAFPIIGLLLGAVSFVVAKILTPVMPPTLLAISITTGMVLLTRGLHNDGLADLVDGIGGGHNPERRLAIMKDSRVGTFGALSLVLTLLFKIASIQTLLSNSVLTPLVAVPALSRFAMVVAAYRSPYARREGGLGKPFLEHMTLRHLLSASLIAVFSCFILKPLIAVPLALAAILVALLLKRMALNNLGGITGDVLGAVNESAETVLLVISASMAAL